MPASLKRIKEIFRDEGAKTLAKKSFTYAKRFFYSPYFLYKSKKIDRGRPIEELVEFSINGCGGLISPLQDRREITGLVKFLYKLKPRALLEIGTASGGTLFLFSRMAADDATIISVDLPYGKFGGGYPHWKIPVYKSFALHKQKIFLIRENSHELQTVQKAEKALDGKKIDFLFIDGDHTYAGAKKDFELYKHLVRKGGVIGFHDIVVHTKESGCDVFRFWNEIKKKYKHKEIVHSWDKRMGGIGLIFV